MQTLKSYIDYQIDELKSAGTFRHLQVLEGPQTARSIVEGRKVINLSSNNYLGLATHPKLVEASIDAVRRYGV